VGRKFEEEENYALVSITDYSQTIYTTKFKAFSSQFVTENSNSTWEYQIVKVTD